MKLTNEDIGRWLVQTHQEIETFHAPRGCGFYVTAMVFDTVVYAIFAHNQDPAIFTGNEELIAVYGDKGGLWRRIRDRRVKRYIAKAIKKEKGR
jgi:hypothetical protein